MTVTSALFGSVRVVTIDRPSVRNAVDGDTAAQLAKAFTAFEAAAPEKVLVLTGAGGNFCAGADLKAFHLGRGNQLSIEGDGPMGPTRMALKKPSIAAVSGYAVAGGLELALLCDLRVCDETAIFGVFCRRFGVPLIDGGTVRLPRIVGMGRALDMVLTGRPVAADEALAMGLANRVVAPGQALTASIALAEQIASFPEACMLGDRTSVYEQAGLPLAQALRREFELGLATIATGETLEGAASFADGKGRHGTPR